jgi:Fe-S cluster assembly iron-binding protein IscA
MALDEPQRGNATFVHGGIAFSIEKNLLAIAGPVHIDFVEWLSGPGFSIKSSLPSGKECGSG